jgi:hypothetical protein
MAEELFSQTSPTLTERLKSLVSKVGSGDELLTQQILTNQLLLELLHTLKQERQADVVPFVFKLLALTVGVPTTLIPLKTSFDIFLKTVIITAGEGPIKFYLYTFQTAATPFALESHGGTVPFNLNIYFPFNRSGADEEIIALSAETDMHDPLAGSGDITVIGEYRRKLIL